MGLFEAMDEHNQEMVERDNAWGVHRDAEWKAAGSPAPPMGRTVVRSLIGTFGLTSAVSLLAAVFGQGARAIAIVVMLLALIGLVVVAVLRSRRTRRAFEEGRTSPRARA